MRDKIRIKLLFLIIFIIGFLTVCMVISNDKDERVAVIQKNQMKNLKTLYRFIMHDFKLAADARYEKIQTDNYVIDILKKAKDLPLDKQKELKDELFWYLEPMFLRLKNIGLTNLHFVFENNRTFLRMHKPKKFGDDLSKFRYTFKYVNEYRTPISGYEQGRTKHGFRYVYPLYDRRGEYLGAVDFTFSSLYLQSVLSNSLGIHSHFLIDKNVFDKKAWEDGDYGYKYVLSKESDNYLIALNRGEEGKKIDKNFHFEITEKLKKKIQKGLKEGKDFSIYKLYENSVVLITFLAIKNVKERKTVAYLVTYTKNKTIYDILKRYKLLIYISFFLLLIIVYFLYRLVVQKNMLKDEVKKQVSYIEKLQEIYDKNIISSTTNLNGEITSVSQAFCTLLGFEKEELIGKKHKIIRHPQTPRSLFKELWETISKGETWKGMMRNIAKDGRTLWFDIVISPIYDEYGNKIGYSDIKHDITDKVNLQKLNQTLEERIIREVETIREKDKQLLQQSRLAQMGEMISMIAHQWRQPLSAISSTSGAIIIKTKIGSLNSEELIKLAQKISQYSQHLSSTIDDFREFFKPNKQKKETTYKEMIESVLNIVEHSLSNQNIELIKNFKSDCKVKTYSNEFKQVVLNLVKNAEDILVDKKVKNPYIVIETEEVGNRAILKIKDNGGGIPSEIIDKIFDPYFSTKTKKDGTGLGLYMSKTIIEEHCKGELRVYNDDKGAVFEILLFKDEPV